MIADPHTVPARPDTTAVHLGVNLFCWDRAGQDRVLASAIGPTVEALRAGGIPSRLWFDRHDARGPHVMALVTVPERSAAHAETLLAEGIARALDSAPPSGVGRTEIQARHEAARRQPLCAEDREPGLAPENSSVPLRVPNEGFPFRLTAHLDAELAARVWTQVSDLAEWAVARISEAPERPRTGLGIHWLASFDLALTDALPGAGRDFWRYFAGSLLPGLGERLDTDPDGALDAVHSAIGANRDRFAGIWRTAARHDPPWPGLSAFAALLAEAHRPATPPAWRLPRTLAHCALKQLGLHQQQELPAVLYGLHRAYRDTDRDEAASP